MEVEVVWVTGDVTMGQERSGSRGRERKKAWRHPLLNLHFLPDLIFKPALLSSSPFMLPLFLNLFKQPRTPCLPLSLCFTSPYPVSFFSSTHPPSIHLSFLGPPVPCTCHRAQPFDKSREGQTEFCRTRQSLSIWLPFPQVPYRIPGSLYI